MYIIIIIIGGTGCSVRLVVHGDWFVASRSVAV